MTLVQMDVHSLVDVENNVNYHHLRKRSIAFLASEVVFVEEIVVPSAEGRPMAQRTYKGGFIENGVTFRLKNDETKYVYPGVTLTEFLELLKPKEKDNGGTS